MAPEVKTVSEQQVYDALTLIVAHQEAPALDYAANYAFAGLGMHGFELSVQCLYVLSNITHWRHEKAKDIRATLKQFAKENNRE